MQRTNLLIIATALVFAVAGFAVSRWMGDGSRDTRPAHGPAPASAAGAGAIEPGAVAPNFSLPDLEGRTRTLGDWPGRWRLVNFWATWCAPCVHEMPVLDAYDRERDDLVLIGVALDTKEAVARFTSRVPVSYPLVLDTAGPADYSVALGNVRGVLPYSVLVSPDGRIAAQRLGDFADRGELDTWVKAAQDDSDRRGVQP